MFSFSGRKSAVRATAVTRSAGAVVAACAAVWTLLQSPADAQILNVVSCASSDCGEPSTCAAYAVNAGACTAGNGARPPFVVTLDGFKAKVDLFAFDDTSCLSTPLFTDEVPVDGAWSVCSPSAACAAFA